MQPHRKADLTRKRSKYKDRVEPGEAVISFFKEAQGGLFPRPGSPGGIWVFESLCAFIYKIKKKNAKQK